MQQSCYQSLQDCLTTWLLLVLGLSLTLLIVKGVLSTNLHTMDENKLQAADSTSTLSQADGTPGPSSSRKELDSEMQTSTSDSVQVADTLVETAGVDGENENNKENTTVPFRSNGKGKGKEDDFVPVHGELSTSLDISSMIDKDS